LAHVAPYLLQLSPADADTQRFLTRAWGRNWGIFFTSGTSPKLLLKHLRSLLRVRMPNGDVTMFRFYDPRVLRAYLPSCTEDEKERLFGPLNAFWMENESADDLLYFPSGRKEPQSILTGSQPDARLSIRPEHIHAFEASARDLFLSQMIAHVEKYFPKRCAQYPPPALRTTITSCIQKAEHYGFRTKREICKFINVAMTFGPDFDNTVSLLQEILAAPEPASRKARRLSETSLLLFRAAKTAQAKGRA
jgi:hypothetical protein